jgi:hypothetical protein
MCRLHKIRAAERLSHVRSRGFSDHQGGAGLGGGGGGQGLLQGMRRQGNLEVDARVSVVAIEGCIERLFFFLYLYVHNILCAYSHASLSSLSRHCCICTLC